MLNFITIQITTLVTLSFLIHSIHAFSLSTTTTPNPISGSSCTTTTTTTTTTTSMTSNSNNKGPISMSISELAEKMGGLGRARLVWDYYSIGIDPAIFFHNNSDDNDEQSNSYKFYYNNETQNKEEWITTIQKLLPSQRRTQPLGKDALQRLASLYENPMGRLEGGVATLSHISQSRDNTTKFLLRMADGLEVESVIIPMNDIRSTLCVSSQVGCRQGCTFCATGRMGKMRSLSSDEIIAQMFFAQKISRFQNLPEIRNIVFMGMGEPADNAEAVLHATKILTTREMFQLSATKVTVSTVAPTPDAFQQFAHAPCLLAWSVHAANNELRKKLVPTTQYTMEELRQGLIDTLLQRPMNNMRVVMLEVALMDGVNDSIKEADELYDFARVIQEQVPGCKLTVNLIPFNDIGQQLYRKPSEERVLAFQRRLWNRGMQAHIRTTRGDDESAACGQLATKKKTKDTA